MSLRNNIVVVDLKFNKYQPFQYYQGDNGCILKLVIHENKRAINLNGYNAVAKFVLPSGTEVLKDCVVQSNIIEVPVDADATNETGRIALNVKVTNGTQSVTTFTIKFTVEDVVDNGENSDNNEQVDLSDYYTKGEVNQLIEDMIRDGIDLTDYALKSELEDKVDKEVNKSLVDNDEIAKIHEHGNKDVLDTITQDKIDSWNEVVQADWNQSNTSERDFIKNKPNLSVYAEKSNYYDKDEIDDKLARINSGGTTDLDGYAKVDDVNNALDLKVDKENGKGLSSNDYTTEDKDKLNGIENNANNYIHPTSHEANMIIEDSTHKFVTDVEKARWNAKSNFSGSFNDLTNKPNMDDYCTEAEVDQKVADALPDMTTYTTKTYVETKLNDKVDKVSGKSLVANTEIVKIHEHGNKTELDKIQDGDVDKWNLAKPNVQADWNVSSPLSDAYIANKPDMSQFLSQAALNTALVDYCTADEVDQKIADAGVGGNVDLDGYVKTTDMNNALNLKVDKTTLTDYVKTNDMNNELSLKVDVTELELYALKTDVNNALNNKVNKETGKSLVSDTEISKIHEHNNKDVLDRITQDKVNAWELAEENVQSDWTNNDIGSDAYILNKPDLSIYAEKDNAVFTSSISLGRKSGTLINVNSFAVGNDVTAKGENSHAEGSNTIAGGTNSHAEGSLTITADNATASHAEGLGTQATAIGQHVEGRYNEANINYAHIVGNGTSDTDRSNAHVLDWDGNAWYKGVVRIDGTPTNDNDLVTKKYVDDLVASMMTTASLSVGSSSLPVGISGVSVGNPNVWYGTHEEYEALVEKDENITYIIKGKK